MKKTLSLVLSAILVLALALGAACSPKQPDDGSSPAPQGDSGDKTLYLLNWGDYLDPQVKDEFRKKTGITVKETPVTSNEEMIIKLDTDDCPYDLCIPSDYAVERLIAKGRLAEINFDNIPNISNIDPEFLKLSEVFDPGNKYSVPYTWGVLGILYNVNMVDEEDLGSWDLLWNEKYSGKIFMYNSIRDSMAAALCKLGYDLNTVNEDEINAAADELIKAKPLVRAWLNDDVKDSMVLGTGAAALVYSGDAVWSMDPDEGSDELEFFVPKEGSNVYFDNIVITANSPRKAMAEQFINFLLDGDIATVNTEYLGYSSPNTLVPDLIDEFFLDCSAYNISSEDVARCKIFHDLGDKMSLYEAAWNRIHK
ncbi:MAG: spermidine/putrescine ABC transporter substrate-binding protein [Clostridia bacterium]|nr:spermidine/putrescine ABC transporter substrate-binding protein [Clostridia bacterium]